LYALETSKPTNTINMAAPVAVGGALLRTPSSQRNTPSLNPEFSCSYTMASAKHVVGASVAPPELAPCPSSAHAPLPPPPRLRDARSAHPSSLPRHQGGHRRGHALRVLLLLCHFSRRHPQGHRGGGDGGGWWFPGRHRRFPCRLRSW
jgi:hypothetical protein